MPLRLARLRAAPGRLGGVRFLVLAQEKLEEELQQTQLAGASRAAGPRAGGAGGGSAAVQAGA